LRRRATKSHLSQAKQLLHKAPRQLWTAPEDPLERRHRRRFTGLRASAPRELSPQSGAVNDGTIKRGQGEPVAPDSVSAAAGAAALPLGGGGGAGGMRPRLRSNEGGERGGGATGRSEEEAADEAAIRHRWSEEISFDEGTRRV